MPTPTRTPPLLSPAQRLWLPAALLLIGFGLMLSGIQRDGLWLDEGWTAALIYDNVPPADSVRGQARQVVDSLLATLERVRAQDVHPPLYYLLLDMWTRLAGESEVALRIISAWAGLVALAGTHALGQRLFGQGAGWAALVLLGTSAFFLYYTREARMYALASAWVVLATYSYAHWRRTPTWRNHLAYGVLAALALYTHYLTALVFVAHGLHWVVGAALGAGRRSVWAYLPILFIVGALVAPWASSAYQQLSANPAGAAAAYLPTDGNTLAALWLVLAHGNGWLIALPLLVTTAWGDGWREPRLRQSAGLVLLWLLLPAALLLALNATGLRLFQLRYVFFCLPALALLLGFGLSRFYLPLVLVSREAPLWRYGALALLVWLALAQLNSDPTLWPAKPRWREAVAQAAQTRAADEPALVHLAPHSPVTYYDRQFNLAEGISIDIGWRPFAPAEVAMLAQTLARSDRVWVVGPAADPSTWDAVRAVSAGRGVGYRDAVQGTIFYRFDRVRETASPALPPTLQWTFADAEGASQIALADVGDIPAQIGRSSALCLAPSLTVIGDLITPHNLGLYLTRGYNEIVAQTDVPLEAATAPHCLPIPADAPLGAMHLRLALYDPQTGTRLQLVEHTDLLWGDYAVLAVVTLVP